MRVYDMGVVASHSISPFALLRGRERGRGAADLFNRTYSDDTVFSEDRFTRTRLAELFDIRQDEEERLYDAFQETEFHDRYSDRGSWILPMFTVEAYRDIPEEMHLPILWYKPVRERVLRGELEGFEGLDPALFDDDDPFERLIENGSGAIQPDGSFKLDWTFKTTDPDLSFKELDMVEEMRAFILSDLIGNGIDPTNSRNTID